MESVSIDVNSYKYKQRLYKINRGHNFLNLDEKRVMREKKYYISVTLETEMDLLKKEEIIEINTNLELSDNYRYHYEGYSLREFFGELEKWAKKPLVKLNFSNRKNKLSYYEIRESDFREKSIDIKDIDISIGELAEKKLKQNKIDFIGKVKEMLGLQKEADEEMQKALDRYIQLKERILQLETFIDKRDDSYYSYSREKDKTTKIMLSPQEYNKELKKVETEMKALAKKLNVGVREDFRYLPIQKKVGYREWLKANKRELDENFENCYDEICDDYGGKPTFEKYAREMYDESGGFVVIEQDFED